MSTQPTPSPPSFIAIDIGGTFTDAVAFRDGKITIRKVSTTYPDPTDGILQAIRELETGGEFVLIHGSTLATNTVLEKKGARTAFIATSGFRDLLLIGRQTRPRLYDLYQSPGIPLIPGELCFEIDERLTADGEVLRKPEEGEVERLISELKERKVEAAAVCFLFSYKDPVHERLIGKRLRDAGFFVSLSSEILPEYREFERAGTTAVNAYVSPVVERYLFSLEKRCEAYGCRELRVMESNGGILSAREAGSQGVRTILSGPAGGVLGGMLTANLAGFSECITLDMGGTSTDVSLCPGRISQTSEGKIEGLPLKIPMIDILAVGAGGGSIARIDEGGVLKVGPGSAGSSPGPVCYGVGEEITVTDAHLVLGRIPEEGLLGGARSLDLPRARRYMKKLADRLGFSVEETAAGILEIVGANMEKALRVISLERGFDCRRFCLVAFGGAGPLHACELAGSLGMKAIVIPPLPGVLSAFGMLTADYQSDRSMGVMKNLADANPVFIERVFSGLLESAGKESEGKDFQDIAYLRSMDLRYRGQSYELEIPVEGFNPRKIAQNFHRSHQARYGYSRKAEEIEIVNCRLRMVGKQPKPVLRDQFRAAGCELRVSGSELDCVGNEAQRISGSELDCVGNGAERISRRHINTPLNDFCYGCNGDKPTTALKEFRNIFYGKPLEKIRVPVYDRNLLAPGNSIDSPSLITQYDSTIFIAPGWKGKVDGYGNIILKMVPFTE